MSKHSQKIDPHQLRILVKANVKTAWRGSSNPISSFSEKKGRIPGIIGMIIVNLLFSVFMGLILLKMHNFLFGLVFSAMGAIILVSMLMLLEFGHVIISPDDYHVIGPLPVSSKTFYAAKLIYLLLYVTAISWSISILPAILAAIGHHSILILPVVFLHYWIVSLFAALLMICIYALIIKSMNRQKVERYMAYVQFFFFLLFYLGLNYIPRELGSVLEKMNIVSVSWIICLPSYWFASWFILGTQGWDLLTFMLGIMGLAILLLLAKAAFSYLSLNYAESITHIVANKRLKRYRQLPTGFRRTWHRLTCPEDRAVLSLLRSQFKFDSRFRLQIFAFLPMVVVFVVLSILKGYTFRDPLAVDPTATENNAGAFLAITVSFLPYLFHISTQYSKDWRASWVFFATPSDRLRIILATKRLIMLMFFLPVGILMFAILSVALGDILHALMHTMSIITIALIALTLMNILTAGFPFSRAQPEGRFSAEVLKTYFAAMVMVMVPVMIVGYTGYGGYLGWTIIMAIMILVYFLFARLQNGEIMEKAEGWEYMG